MRQYFLAASASCLLGSSLALAAPADDVKALMEQGKPQEAYQLGRSHPDQLGNPAFDFFFGIASVDAGRAGEGVLALERYLLNFPDNRSARFHLARGYFVLGEDQRARDEFESLLAGAEAVEKSAIERFLDAIRSRESRYQPSGSAYLEAGLGWDSNINAGLKGGATPFVPGLGNLAPLADNAVAAKQADSFTSLAGGAQGIYPVRPGLALYGAAGFEARLHHKRSDDIFDQINVGAAGGLSYLSGRNLFKLGVGLGQVNTDDQRFVQTTAVHGEWHHQADQFNRYQVGLQRARFHYDDMYVYPLKDKSVPMVFSENSVRTSDFTGLTVGWTRALEIDYQPVLTLGANYGEERNQRNRPDLSRDIVGLRAGLSLTPAPRWGASVGLGYQDIKYKGAFSVLAPDRRKDSYVAVDASLAHYYSRNLSFKVDLLLANQRSNVDIYDYDRNMITFKVRYDFK